MKPVSQKFNSGFTLIEILIAISALGIIVVSIAQMSQLFLHSARLSSSRVEAAFLLQEGAEALRHLRDTSWHDFIDTITTGTPNYILFTSGTYETTTTEPMLLGGRFARSITLYDVFRDATTQDIVETGGVLSTSTKRVEIIAAWRQGQTTTTETVELFLSDIFDN